MDIKDFNYIKKLVQETLLSSFFTSLFSFIPKSIQWHLSYEILFENWWLFISWESTASDNWSCLNAQENLWKISIQNEFMYFVPYGQVLMDLWCWVHDQFNWLPQLAMNMSHFDNHHKHKAIYAINLDILKRFIYAESCIGNISPSVTIATCGIFYEAHCTIPYSLTTCEGAKVDLGEVWLCDKRVHYTAG